MAVNNNNNNNGDGRGNNTNTAALTALKKMLIDLDKQNINYCILRNYEFLLGELFPMESVDTVVSREDFVRMDALLRSQGFQKRRPQFSLQHHAYFKHVGRQMISFDLQVGGVHWNDMVYLDEILLVHRVKKDFFYVLSDEDAFVMLLAHSILGKRYFKLKYQQILHQLLSERSIDRDYVLHNLGRIFSGRKARELLEIVRKNELKKINSYILILIFLLKKPARLLTFTALFFRWVRWKKPLHLSPLISIVGPDGAGKSTMVQELADYLSGTHRKISVIYAGRGRNHLLPFMSLGRRYKTAEKKRDAKKDVEDVQQMAVSSDRNRTFIRTLIYTASSFIFAADLFLRYWAFIFPRRLCRQIVLTDRYYSDILLMKNVPWGFKKFICSFFPSPTISILLYNTPDILHQRRLEESIFELQRQLDLFHKSSYSLRVCTTNEKEDQNKVICFIADRLVYNWE